MFSVFELGRFGSRKVALYRFAQGAVAWRYTSHTSEVTVGAEVFVPVRGISHGEVRESAASPQKNQLPIKMPYRINPAATDAPPCQDLGDQLYPYAPSQRVLVTVMTRHLGDPDNETNVEWLGRVVGSKLNDTSMELTCDPSYRSPRSSGRQRRIGRVCDVPLFSQGMGMCNLAKEPHAVAATLTAVNGLTLSAAAFNTAPRPLEGGFIEWTRTNGLVEKRTIWAHLGTDIVINYGGPELAAALEVTAYPSCAHNLAACTDYGNEENYPGFVNLPSEDPMPRSQAW